MKTARILIICVLAFGLVFFPVKPAGAAPMGTAFTYQGHLYDANYAANGLYDFAFKLYDANVGGSKVGTDVNVADIDVIDAYFTVELDFGSGVFDGDARWLEIGIRPGEMNDPNVYTALSPRQEVTPAPYALYAEAAGGAVGGIKGSGTDNYIPKFTGSDTLGDSLIYESHNNVGIGTTSPAAKLDVAGTGLFSSAVSDIDVLTVISTGTDSIGVFAETTAAGSMGVVGEANAPGGIGVFGNGFGVGVMGCASGPNGVAGAFTHKEGGRVLDGSIGPDGSASQVFFIEGNGDMWLAGRLITAGAAASSFAGDLSVFGSVSVDNDFGTQGNGYIGGDLNVGGVLLATLYDINTPGNGHIGGSLSVDEDLIAGDDLSVVDRLEVGSDVIVSGDLSVAGALSKGSGSFKIDHPLDPENKYLSHSFVESPDMMNVYNGNVVLDEKGCALVKLPEYFEALNTDFRYQLTCIGNFSPVYIAEEISNNHFKIAGGKTGMKVSWQVTGIRQDAFAKANRIAVEETKSAEERGYYLHPQAYGLGKDKSITHLQSQRTDPVARVAGKAGEL